MSRWLPPPARLRRLAVLALLFALALAAWLRWGRWRPEFEVRTVHFAIAAACPRPVAEAAGRRCEAVLAAFAAAFAIPVPAAAAWRVRLYRDHAELRRWNPGSGWADGFYDGAVCHAYPEDGPGGLTVVAHESVHLLVRELAGWRLERWQDEGLATLLSSLALRDGRLDGEDLDRAAYPLDRVRGLGLSGDLARDLAAGRFAPLATALAEARPADLDQHVSLYYAEWWATSHVLWFGCGEAGRQAYRELLAGRMPRERFDHEVVAGLGLEGRVHARLCRLAGISR